MLAVLCSCFPLTSSCCCFFWEDGSKKKEKKNFQTLYMCVGTLLEGKYAILAAEFLQLSVGLRLLADKSAATWGSDPAAFARLVPLFL